MKIGIPSFTDLPVTNLGHWDLLLLPWQPTRTMTGNSMILPEEIRMKYLQTAT